MTYREARVASVQSAWVRPPAQVLLARGPFPASAGVPPQAVDYVAALPEVDASRFGEYQSRVAPSRTTGPRYAPTLSAYGRWLVFPKKTGSPAAVMTGRLSSSSTHAMRRGGPHEAGCHRATASESDEPMGSTMNTPKSPTAIIAVISNPVQDQLDRVEQSAWPRPREASRRPIRWECRVPARRSHPRRLHHGVEARRHRRSQAPAERSRGPCVSCTSSRRDRLP